MLKRLFIVFGAILTALSILSVALAYKVPDEIIIKRPAGNTPLSTWVGEVVFPHGMHATKNACTKCHHKESAKTLGEFVPCSQCHQNPDPNDRTGFFRAWHTVSAPSCLGCHTTQRTEGGKNPVGCTTACHKQG